VIESQLPPSASASKATTTGNATIAVGPKYYGEEWHIATVAISMTAQAPVGTLGADFGVEWRGYVGPAVPENLVLTSSVGTGDSSSNDGITLNAGEIFTSVWSNPTGTISGTVTAALSLTGTLIKK
jgi:hypothetical protein